MNETFGFGPIQTLIDRDGERLVFTIGKHGILWKLDRASGEFFGYKETVYQNTFSDIDPNTGEVSDR